MSLQSKGFALVTGASRGIGYELAKQFAQHGFDVLIVADSERIHEAAKELAQTGADVQSLQADLTTMEGTESVYQKIRSAGRPLDAVAMNAGVGVSGPFHETDVNQQLDLIRLNVLSPVYLTHLILKDMVARRSGRILYTSSIAAATPGPFDSAYNASKGFLKLFAEGIREELRDTGITVTVLMPGATDTNFFHRAGAEDTKLGVSEKDDAAEVAQEGFDALMAGTDHVVAGSFKNKVQATVAHILPDSVTAAIHRKESEPGSASR